MICLPKFLNRRALLYEITDYILKYEYLSEPQDKKRPHLRQQTIIIKNGNIATGPELDVSNHSFL